MEQKSNEWHEARRGLFTASQIANILKPKGIGKVAESYIYEKAAEKIGVKKEEITSKEMNWGNDWEYTAINWYSRSFDLDVSELGFIKHPKHETGCSPDGWIHKELKGLEIKCPYTIDKHLKVACIKDEKELKNYNDNYYWQCKLSMFVMDCDKWDFASFDPRYNDEYKMFVLTLNRDEKEDLFIIERLNLATEMRDEIINKIKMI